MLWDEIIHINTYAQIWWKEMPRCTWKIPNSYWDKINSEDIFPSEAPDGRLCVQSGSHLRIKHSLIYNCDLIGNSWEGNWIQTLTSIVNAIVWKPAYHTYCSRTVQKPGANVTHVLQVLTLIFLHKYSLFVSHCTPDWCWPTVCLTVLSYCDSN